MSLRILQRSEFVTIILVVMGITLLGAYFFNVPILNTASNEFMLWGVILSAFAYFVGLVSLTIFHIRHIMKRTRGKWYLNAYLVVMLWFWIIFGLVFTSSSNQWQWFMDNLYNAVENATYSLSAFFIFSAAYRAFRVKNVDATLLLVVGIICMLRNVPLGNALFPSVAPLADWLINVPGMAAQRGLTISIGVGLAMFSFRILIGRERAALGMTEREEE